MSDEVRQPRRSLQLRFVLLVALLMVGLAAMLGTATVATQRRNARAAVEDRVAAVGELVALDSSSRNDRSDAPSLRLLGEFLRDQPGAIGAYILAPDGEILAGGVDTVGLDLGATGQAFADPAGVVAQATIRANVGGAQAGTAVIGEFGGALHSAQAIMVDGQHVRTITFVTSLDEVGDATRTGILLVLAVSALFLLVGLTVTAVVMRRVTRRLTRLTDAAEELSEVRLPALVAQMQSDGAEPEVGGDPVVIDTDGGDEVARLAQAFAAMQITTEEVAHTQSELLKRGIGDIFVQLARRNQSLIDRQIEVIDVLEAGERSPDSLAGLFKLDHLAARMRRNAESLLVLAGESQTNVRARPSSLTDVIRVAIGEVEHYHRVEVEEVASMMVQGSAASGLAHLLAELLDNALRNAPEVTRVTVSASRRDDGTCSVEIVDQGVGMTSDQLTEYNTLLASPPPMGLSLDKALGFIVVGRLAQQFDAEVILRPGNHGGLVAHVLLPTSMLSEKRELRRSGDDEPVDPRPTSTAAVDPRPPSPASKRSEIAGLGEVAGVSSAGLPTRGRVGSGADDEDHAVGDPEPIPNATRASLAGFDLDAIAPDAGLIETLPDPLLDGPATEPLVDAPPLPSRMTIDELDALLAEPDAALPEADDLAAEAATADEPTADALEDMEAATVDGPGDMDAAADEADDPVDRDEPVAEEPSVPRRPAGLAVRAEPPESVEAESGDAEPAEPQKPEDANQIVAETLDAESIDAEPVEAVVALPVVEPTRTEESTPAFEDEPIVAAADVDAPAPAIPAEASPPLEELAALPPLPKRRRGATMGLPAPAVPEADAASVFPASAAASEHDEPAAPARGDLQQIAERQSSGRRSPEDLKRMLSSYRRGVERSRYDRPE